MPAKRGRTITSFGQFFVGLSGGVTSALVVRLGALRLVDVEVYGMQASHRQVGKLALSDQLIADLTIGHRDGEGG